MATRTLALSLLVAAALAGCGTTYDEPAPMARAPATQPPAPVVSASPTASAGSSTPVALATLKSSSFRPGSGILESISLTTLPASAAAGGTAASTPVPGPYRLSIRMEDGNIQTVEADTRALLVGDRVQITADGRLIRP